MHSGTLIGGRLWEGFKMERISTDDSTEQLGIQLGTVKLLPGPDYQRVTEGAVVKDATFDWSKWEDGVVTLCKRMPGWPFASLLIRHAQQDTIRGISFYFGTPRPFLFDHGKEAIQGAVTLRPFDIVKVVVKKLNHSNPTLCWIVSTAEGNLSIFRREEGVLGFLRKSWLPGRTIADVQAARNLAKGRKNNNHLIGFLNQCLEER